MDIIAKAKPVRFRIVSSGVECTSLDDLRAHFDLKSVADTINDGRLEKWLNNIKEYEFAKQVKEIGKFDSSNMEMSLKVLSLFTGKKYNREKYISDIEYIKFLDKDKNTSEFAVLMIKEFIHKDVDVLLYAYHNHAELVTDVHTYFEPFLKTSRVVMWLYGKFLVDSNEEDSKEKGLEFIRKAAEKGHKEAEEFLRNEGRKAIEDLDNEELQREVTSIILMNIGTYSGEWQKKSDIASKLLIHLASLPQYSQETKEIFKLFSKFCKLAKLSHMWMIRNELEILKIQKYGTAQKLFDFIDLYAREEIMSKDKVISSYKGLNYLPATKRAEEIQKMRRGIKYKLELVTKQNRHIRMPENPDYSQFIHFLYSFMTNIMYL